MEKLVSLIIKSLLGFFKLWYDAERREAAEWEAKAMRGKMMSMKTTAKVEKRINAALPKEAVTTAAAWNARARVGGAGLILFLCLSFSGCLFTKYVYVEGQWPVIAVPAPPRLPVEDTAIPGRVLSMLGGYAMLLEARIDAYNKEAHAHNVKHGYEEAADVTP